jgi:uncharacterized protein (DUF2236 family)
MGRRCVSLSLKTTIAFKRKRTTHPKLLWIDDLNKSSMSLHDALANFAQQTIGERVRALTGSQSNLDDFMSPKGDQGLFGPDSLTWRVHANFTAMMVGGLSSLVVQSLHPRALSAVWDHSDFRNRLKERLGRTAFFVAATTYGSEAMAMGAIHRVNAIHAKIRGTDLDGKPYIANEPALLRWVHIAEVSSFLSAYQHLSNTPLSLSECDQYIREMTQIGHLLGAVDLPLTWQSTQNVLVDYKSQLRFDQRAKEILSVVENYPTDILDKPFICLTLKAAFDVMPAWLLERIEKQPTCAVQQQATKFALNLAAQPIQWTLDQQGVCAVSRARVQRGFAAT